MSEPLNFRHDEALLFARTLNNGGEKPNLWLKAARTRRQMLPLHQHLDNWLGV
jgi:hypothetical protein